MKINKWSIFRKLPRFKFLQRGSITIESFNRQLFLKNLFNFHNKNVELSIKQGSAVFIYFKSKIPLKNSNFNKKNVQKFKIF